jgi:hypothetical protein
MAQTPALHPCVSKGPLNVWAGNRGICIFRISVQMPRCHMPEIRVTPGHLGGWQGLRFTPGMLWQPHQTRPRENERAESPAPLLICTVEAVVGGEGSCTPRRQRC